MAIAESEVRWVGAPKLGFWDQLYLPALVDGLKTTIGHIAAVTVTEIGTNSLFGALEESAAGVEPMLMEA